MADDPPDDLADDPRAPALSALVDAIADYTCIICGNDRLGILSSKERDEDAGLTYHTTVTFKSIPVTGSPGDAPFFTTVCLNCGNLQNFDIKTLATRKMMAERNG